MARRRRPWNKGRKFKARHRKGRKIYVSNPHKKHRRHHRRHKNPDIGMLWKIGLAAAAGIGVSVAGAMALDAVWMSGSAKAKTGVIVGAAALVAIFLGPSSPVLAAGIATGMVLVPGQQLIASFISPSAAVASAPQISPAPGTGLLNDGMGALHGVYDGAAMFEDRAAFDDAALLRARGLID